MNKVLDVQNLHVSFDTYAGEVKAVRGVTFSLSEGEVLAIVGESGCGKSVTAQTIMKLNPMPPARIKEGSVQLGEHDIVAANEKEMQKIRGKEVSMIFQDPMTCLNPTKPVGKQIVEAIQAPPSSFQGRRRRRKRSSTSPLLTFRTRRSVQSSIRTNSPAACVSVP